MLRSNAGKMAIVIIAVLLVICSVAGVAVFTKKGHAKGADGKAAHGPKTSVAIGEMVVNLADTNEIRYAKADIVLEMVGKFEAGGGGHGGGGDSEAKAPLRDAIIGVISSKRFVELAQPGGKESLKAEIVKACNERLESAKVENVYFNQFAMQ